MAYKIHSSLLAFLFILGFLLAIANEAVAGRTVPKNSKKVDKKQPEWLIDHHHDGSVLIPGLGRVLLPPHGHVPYKYNPITGTSGGTGLNPGYVPGGGSSSETRPRRQYIPGNDDTFVPNPGFEVPIPGRGGDGVPIAATP